MISSSSLKIFLIFIFSFSTTGYTTFFGGFPRPIIAAKLFLKSSLFWGALAVDFASSFFSAG
jgi:hypothetical protein